MSSKIPSLELLAAIGIIVLPIPYLSLPVDLSLLRAGDKGSSLAVSEDPTREFSRSTLDTLKTSDVEITFAVDVPNYHVGIEQLKNLTDSKTVYFDEDKHLWTIALLDTAGTMTAGSLHNISFDDSTIVCDTLKCTFKNNYPDTLDKSLLFNWVGVVDTTNFPNDTLNVDVLVTIFKDEEDVSFSVRIVKTDINSPEASLFNVDFPHYLVEEYDTSAAKQILAYPYSGHGNLIVNPILELDPVDNSDFLDQNNRSTNRDMGFSTKFPVNRGLHPGLASMQFFSYYSKSDSTALYAATTDTMGYLKLLHISGDDSLRTLECFTRHFPKNNDSFFDSTYSLPYYYKMRAFEGDWVDASKIYREWLINSFIAKDAGGTLGYRTDFLAVVDSMHYVFSYDPQISLLRQQLNKFFFPDSVLKAGGRISKWGDITPDFWVDDCVCLYADSCLSPRAWVSEIKGGHGVVGAYTNLTMPWWSYYEYPDSLGNCTHSYDCEDDADSTYHNTILYSINGVAFDPDGRDSCRLPLCNAAELWQDKYVAGIDSTLGDSLLANMVYTDRGGYEVLCYRGATHGHVNGGGYYYIQGRKDVMDTIDEHIDSLDAVIITINEAGYDIKMGWYDYYANWGGFMGGYDTKQFHRLIPDEWKEIEEVPMFPAVWHENQATVMGLIREPYSGPDSTTYGDNHWVLGLAWVFMNGSMPAFRQDSDSVANWDSTQVDDYGYVKSLLNKRNDIRNYLVYGEWMRPPALDYVDSTEVTFWDLNPVELPAILSAAYLRVDSLGAEIDSLGLAMLFTNYSDTTLDGDSTATCSLYVDFSTYFSNISLNSFELCELVFDDSTRNCAQLVGNVLDTALTLASDSTAVFRVVPIDTTRGYPEEQKTYIIED